MSLKNIRSETNCSFSIGPTTLARSNGHPSITSFNNGPDSQSRRFSVTLHEKWRILKNVLAVSAAFMVHFTAFQGTVNLQSSLHPENGLGMVSLSALYAAAVLSCLFLPTIFIKKFTAKWTLCISMLCYLPYYIAQFYARFYTLVPAGILLGMGAAPMWAAKASYLTQTGAIYARITNQPIDAIIVRFFGFFFLAWQTAELWGNLISSLILSNPVHGGGGGASGSSYPKQNVIDMSTSTNTTTATTATTTTLACGASFCQAPPEVVEKPDSREIALITSIYLVCVLIAVAIIVFFVDPLTRYGERRQSLAPSVSNQNLSAFQLLAATANQMNKKFQQLLIPITIWIGIEQAFISAEFTQAYVSCKLGISLVGYIMISYGIVNAICSIVFGWLMKFTGRIALIFFGAAVHAFVIVFLRLWSPENDDGIGNFYLVSTLWGIGDAVWQTQLNGLYGTLFRRNKEAAFSNYRLWESLGFVVAYAYSPYCCVDLKLYIMMIVLAVGMIGYCVVEVMHYIKLKTRLAEGGGRGSIDGSICNDKSLPKVHSIQNLEATEELYDETDDIDNEIIIVTSM